jgi:hypothetical protein
MCSSCWSFHLLREEFLSAPIHSPPLWFAVSVLHRRASSMMAPARATGCKVARSWVRQFLSFQSDQATNHTRVSKPLREGLVTAFRICNHQTANVARRTKFLDCGHNQGVGDPRSRPPVHRERKRLCHSTHDVKVIPRHLPAGALVGVVVASRSPATVPVRSVFSRLSASFSGSSPH